LDSSVLLSQYKGVGILRGASDASPTVRTYLADGQDAERILTIARSLRQRAGTLSGMALGEADTQPPASIAADVLAVFTGQPGLARGPGRGLPGRLRRRAPRRVRRRARRGLRRGLRGRIGGDVMTRRVILAALTIVLAAVRCPWQLIVIADVLAYAAWAYFH